MEKIATLISKEADLIYKWISQKFGEESAEITQNPKKYPACPFDIWEGFPRNAGHDSCRVSVSRRDKRQKYLEEICSEIYGSLQGFGLNLHSQALYLMTLPTFEDDEIERPDSERER